MLRTLDVPGVGRVRHAEVERAHAARHGRSGPDGRQHGRAAARPPGTRSSGTTATRRVSDVARLAELVEALAAPRVVWVMVPADGHRGDDRRTRPGCSARATSSSTAATRVTPTTGPGPSGWPTRGIGYVDVGVSGGVWGRENGYGLMVGGATEHVAAADADLRGAQAGGRVRLRARRAGRRRPLREDGAQRHRVRADARLRRGLRAAPGVRVRRPTCRACFKSWREGTVVRSWLLDLLDRALDEDPELAALRGYAEDTGEGRWTVEEAIRLAVPLQRHRRVAVRPVRLPPGRLAGHEGGRRAAQPVRRPRGQEGRRAGRAWRTVVNVYVRRLELVDFRSYERVEVDLEPGPSVLVGPNGYGKTNLVEALGYVATLGSHRVATDQPLVRAGAERAIIRCAVVHDERELLVELEIVPGKANRARLGRSPVDPGPRHPRRAAAGALRAGGPGAGPRRPGRAAPLPRRSAGAAPAAVRRRAGRLRAGAQAAQRPAAHRLPGAQGGRPGPRRPVHPGRLGRAPGPARRRAVAGRLELCAALGHSTWQGVRRGERRARRGPDRVRGEVLARDQSRVDLDRAAIEDGCSPRSGGGRTLRSGAWGHAGRPAPRRPRR